MSSTKDIREAVEARAGPSTRSSTRANISVKNINGDVALNGTVPSYPQYLEAATAAQRVNRGEARAQPPLGRVAARNYRDDVQLTTAANNALTLNVTRAQQGIEATARDGNLTLTGDVGLRLPARRGRARGRPADRTSATSRTRS